MELQIKISDIVIKIEYRYGYIPYICKDYLAPEGAEPDFCVSVTDAEIEAQRKLLNYEFSEAICEGTAVQEAILDELALRGIIFIHSAVIEHDNCAYSFLAPSGVGKSTHCRQWLQAFGDKAKVLNGDKPFYSFKGNEFFVFGSPWRGKESWGYNGEARVKGLCFLERGETNEIRKATEQEVITKLFSQICLPKNPVVLASFMPIMNKIVTTVPCYILKCNISTEAALVAYEGMNKE